MICAANEKLQTPPPPPTPATNNNNNNNADTKDVKEKEAKEKEEKEKAEKEKIEKEKQEREKKEKERETEKPGYPSTSLAPNLASKYYEDVLHHFAILSVTTAPKDDNRDRLMRCFLKAVVQVVSAENRTFARAALRAIEVLVETRMSFVPPGSPNYEDDIPDFTLLATLLYEACYHQEWAHKLGGCQGIIILSTAKLPLSWKKRFQVEFVTACLFALKVFFNWRICLKINI